MPEFVCILTLLLVWLPPLLNPAVVYSGEEDECCPESSLTWAQELGPCHWSSLGSVNQGKDAFIFFSYKQSKLIVLPRALEARL